MQQLFSVIDERIWIGFDVLCSRFNWIVVSSSAKLKSFYDQHEIISAFLSQPVFGFDVLCFLLSQLNWIELYGEWMMLFGQLNWKALWFFYESSCFWEMIEICICILWQLKDVSTLLRREQAASIRYFSSTNRAPLSREGNVIHFLASCILLLFGVGKTLCLSLQHVLFFIGLQMLSVPILAFHLWRGWPSVALTL